MIVRSAGVADAPAIQEIWNHMIENTLFTFNAQPRSLTEVEAMIKTREGGFFVVQDPAPPAGQIGEGRAAEGVAGFVTFAQFRGGVGYAATVEHTIALRAGAAPRGAGRALMVRAMQAAADKGHHIMVAAITGDNPRAVAFHRGLGFEHSGFMPQVGYKWGAWRDLILMQKTLEPRPAGTPIEGAENPDGCG